MGYRENIFRLLGKCFCTVGKMFLDCRNNVFVLLGECIWTTERMFIGYRNNFFQLVSLFGTGGGIEWKESVFCGRMGGNKGVAE